MKRMMAAAMILLVSAAWPVSAERRRAAAPPEETLSIVFVEVGSSDESLKAAGSEAWLDLNAVTHSGSERSTRLRRRFGIRIERAGNATAGTAAIVARLESWDGRATYRLHRPPPHPPPVFLAPHPALRPVPPPTPRNPNPPQAAPG